MCNKGILFSISYMPMHDIFDCAQKKKKKNKRKEKEKGKKKSFYTIACVFSKRCESYMMYFFR